MTHPRRLFHRKANICFENRIVVRVRGFIDGLRWTVIEEDFVEWHRDRSFKYTLFRFKEMVLMSIFVDIKYLGMLEENLLANFTQLTGYEIKIIEDENEI